MNSHDISPDLISQLNGLEPHLRSVIRGQGHIIPRVASVLQRGELGFTKSNRPRGSFLFLGPTGVGKTELALAFTSYLFGGENLIRLDMSEYQTQDRLAVLLGANSRECGTLGQALKRIRSGTILFDESEKAHPRVLDILLQILDAARVTLATGETVDLSNFYIVLTSNLGAADVMQLQHAPFSTMERHVLSRANRTFRPELFARITEKLVFNRLTYDTQLEIAESMLTAELAFLAEKGIHLTAAPEVLPFLIQRGFHPHLGARPLRDVIEKHVRDAVATHFLSKSAAKLCSIVVGEGGLGLRTSR